MASQKLTLTTVFPMNAAVVTRHLSTNRPRMRLKNVSRRKVKYIAGVAVISACSGLAYHEWLKLQHAVHFKISLPDTRNRTQAGIAGSQDNIVTKVKHKLQWELSALEHFLEDKGIAWLPLDTSRDDPWKLLRRAQYANQHERLVAVSALASKHHWADSEYRAVAQACKQRTLIGLARSHDVDLRFFAPPPPLPKSKDTLQDELCTLVGSLPRGNIDKCTEFFTFKAMREGHHALAEDHQNAALVFGGTPLSFVTGLSKRPQESQELNYLLALLSHSEVSSHCIDIVDNDGLQLLMRYYLERGNSPKIQCHIAHILANMSVHPKLHDCIVQAGWVTILAKWMKSNRIELAGHASRALANLDRDCCQETYHDGVYLLHPQTRTRMPPEADIVFVHGLMGGAFHTWRQQDPKTKKKKDAPKSSEGHWTSIKTKSLNFRKNKSNDTCVKNVDCNDNVKDEKQQNMSDTTVSGTNNNDTNTTGVRIDSATPGVRIDTTTSVGKNTATPDVENDTTTPGVGKDTYTTGVGSDTATQSVNIQCNGENSSGNNEGLRENGEQQNTVINVEDAQGSRGTSLRKQCDKDVKEGYTDCWPKSWLTEDAPDMRIITVSYESHITEWAVKCPYESKKRSLANRSAELLSKLKKAGVGERPIIWVTHSMGGLLVKQMLVDASSKPELEKMIDNTQGVVFFSTPHHGASLAALSQQAQFLLYPTVEVKDLTQGVQVDAGLAWYKVIFHTLLAFLKMNCPPKTVTKVHYLHKISANLGAPYLKNLHGLFRAFVQTHNIPVLSFGEKLPTNIGLSIKTFLVPKTSSHPGFGEYHTLDVNHLDICKPADRQSLLYVILVRFITENVTRALHKSRFERLTRDLYVDETEDCFYPLGISFGE